MAKLPKFCLAVALAGSCTGNALAQADGEAAKVAIGDLAKEMVECAAYYDIVSLVMLRSNQRETSQKYVEARKLAVGRANSLIPKIVNERYDSTIEGMIDTLARANMPRKVDKSLTNVSIGDLSSLRNEYGRLCKEALNSPGERAKYWMEQARKPSQ